MQVRDYTMAKKHHNVKEGVLHFSFAYLHLSFRACTQETVVKTNPRALLHKAST